MRLRRRSASRSAQSIRDSGMLSPRRLSLASEINASTILSRTSSLHRCGSGSGSGLAGVMSTGDESPNMSSCHAATWGSMGLLRDAGNLMARVREWDSRRGSGAVTWAKEPKMTVRTSDSLTGSGTGLERDNNGRLRVLLRRRRFGIAVVRRRHARHCSGLCFRLGCNTCSRGELFSFGARSFSFRFSCKDGLGLLLHCRRYPRDSEQEEKDIDDERLRCEVHDEAQGEQFARCFSRVFEQDSQHFSLQKNQQGMSGPCPVASMLDEQGNTARSAFVRTRERRARKHWQTDESVRNTKDARDHSRQIDASQDAVEQDQINRDSSNGHAECLRMSCSFDA
ncbi:hypothetical protein BN2475_10043 [Paraburkholderia ribeironis]|uniref:Uncharacterized protein n=1 Tax=Paraburkholderia ribeironis TaxID=1247936 RepID=A0A1N7RJL5_9BURK|nr:hypothetical protein BN2475_10043 [Paraburkholderia ribeironis]